MNRKLLLLLLGMIFMLTGCFKFNSDLVINSDGSSDLSFIYGMEKQLAAMDTENSLEEIKTDAEDDGFKVSDYEDDTFVGYKMTKHFKTLAELSKEFDSEGMGIDIKEEKGFIKNKYIITGNFDMKGLTGNSSESEDGFDQQMQESFISQMDLKFTLTQPQKAGKNNADEVKSDGKKLEWKLAANDENKIQSEYETINYINIFLLVGGVVIIFAVILIVLIKSKKKKTNGAI